MSQLADSANATVEQLLSELNGQLNPELAGRSADASGVVVDSEPDAGDAAQLKSSAEVLIAAGDVGLARNILRSMIQNGLLVGWALRQLGRILEDESRPEAARRCYQDSIAYEPSLEAYHALASLELRARNDAAAADALERAGNLTGLNSRIRVELHKAAGNCWLRAHKPEKAEAHYRKALSIDPTHDALASNLGALYLQSGRIQDAARAFGDALVANPSNSKAHAGLASAFLAQGRKREAHDHFALSLEHELQQPTVIYHLVKCAYEIKSYATAARLLQNYVEVAPVNANLLYSLGGLQFHLGRIEEAAQTVARILKIQPNHSGAAELQKLTQRYSRGNEA